MEIFTTIGFWQWAVVILTIVAAFYASGKNRIINAKLAVMLGLTIVVALQLCKTVPPKETVIDAGIRQLCTKLEGDALRTDMPAEFTNTLKQLTELNLRVDERTNKEQSQPLLAELEKANYPADFIKQRVVELAKMWRTRMENSAGAIRERLSQLSKIAAPTPTEQNEISELTSLIPAWYDRVPLKFGLDLRGGTEMRLRLLPDTARLEKLQRDLELLQGENKPENAAKIATLQKNITDEKDTLTENFRNASNVIRNRLNASGLEEISVTVQGNDKLLVQIPGMSSSGAQAIIDRVKRMGQLEFRLAIPDKGAGADAQLISMMHEIGGKSSSDQRNFSKVAKRFLSDEEIKIDADGTKRGINSEELYDWLHTEKGEGFVLSQIIEMTGDYISAARATPSTQHPGQYEILFSLTPKGSFIFERVTSNNIGRNLAIILDGKLKSAPTIQSAISHQGTITGSFSLADAQSLEVVLKDSLKTQVEVDFENTVGPTLGEDSIRQSVVAIIFGFIGVLIFMVVYYRTAGVITDVVLFINFLLIMALLSALDATLTLPGIAGLVLTVGMAVDANVLIFERIREERDKGNTLSRSVQLGYERAFVTIVDANVTTFITALILDQFGTEAVRGFAKTMIVGIICSVFTSLVLTRWCFEALIYFGKLKELKMMRFFKKSSFAFSRVRRIAMVISLIFIAMGMMVFIARGQKNLAQDFTGGMFAQVSLRQPLSIVEARQKTANIQAVFADLNIQSYGQSRDGKFSDFIIRTAKIKDASLPDNAKENIGLRSANDLRAMLAQDFALQPDGLVIKEERVKEKSTADTAIFAMQLSLLNSRTPSEMQKILQNNTTLKNIEVNASEAGKLAVLAGLPLVSQEGIQRTDADLMPLIRDQIQKLRDLGIVDFTEPFPRFNTVGSAVADEMIESAIGALLFALVLIFVYIWLRFQFRVSFGAGAVIALAHDVLFCLGVLAIVDQFGLLNGQISLVVVAAFLTLVGYSLNDTIVIFDRIRENLRTTNGLSITTLIDNSINQTLARTIITSLSTLLVITVLLWQGGEVLQGFSFVMFIGIIVGTYSSIFIASPILIEFALWSERRKNRQTEARFTNEKPATDK